MLNHIYYFCTYLIILLVYVSKLQYYELHIIVLINYQKLSNKFWSIFLFK